jgi:acyl-CoA synthetase (NDP forming)
MQPGRMLYTPSQLQPLIAPRSIAVVGASGRAGFANYVTKTLQAGPLADSLHLVNPRDAEVLGIRTVPNISDLPVAVDLAVIGMRADLVIPALRQAGERGVRAALIHASGFAEMGTASGIAAQAEIAQIAQLYDMRICGPNILGMFNYVDRVFISGPVQEHEAGPIGIVAQSGSLGQYLGHAPIPKMTSHILLAGNSADVDSFDYANYLVHQDGTRVVAMSIEGVRSVDRILELGEASRQLRKPVVVYKSGRSVRGARAALSHTASLVGSSDVVRAAFARAGLIEVDSWDDILETALFFVRAKQSHGLGVGVVTAMGGVTVSAADAADAAGVELPPLAPETRDKLIDFLPDFATCDNPTDLTAAMTTGHQFADALRMMASDPSFDVIVMPLAPAPTIPDRPSQVGLAAGESDKTIAVYWTRPLTQGVDFMTLLSDPSICLFTSIDRLFQTVARWHAWYRDLDRPVRVDVKLPAPLNLQQLVTSVDGSREGPKVLSEVGARTLCDLSSIPVVPGQLATTADEAAAVADVIGYPVVLKAIAPEVPHKTEVGAVLLGLTNDAAVRAGFHTVIGNLQHHAPEATLEGVLVTKMIEQSTEVIVGARRDPLFGPVAVCGLGGIFVELLGPPVVELAPLNLDIASRMIERMQGHALLDQFRGQPPRDVEALAQIIVDVSSLLAANDAVVEIDLNPVLVGAHGALAADALVVLDQST